MRIILTGACGHIGSYIAKNISKIKNIKEIILIDNYTILIFESISNFFNSAIILSSYN